MPDDTQNPFGITREDVLNLAAQKLVDRFDDYEELNSLADKLIRESVAKRIADTVPARVEECLRGELERLLATEISPVDIWGAVVGKPTTVRDALTESAKAFWSTKVNHEGKPSDPDRYSSDKGKTRAEWIIQKITAEEFSGAIKQNLVNIVAAFKDALREQAQKDIGEHLNKLLVVKSHGDR